MHPIRRKDRARDRAFALEVLRDCAYATLATINEDSTPYCIPISFALAGEDHIYFHCALEGHKTENLNVRPKVCLSCVRHVQTLPEVFSAAYESAVVFGTASIVADDGERMEAFKIICQKYVPDTPNIEREILTHGFSRALIYKITIDLLTAKARIT